MYGWMRGDVWEKSLCLDDELSVKEISNCK